MESILVDEEVWLGETRATAQKSLNFWSDCWIALKCLQEFTDVVFLGIIMELILGNEEVWSGETRVTAKKGLNF